jgi:hypothetical protein
VARDKAIGFISSTFDIPLPLSMMNERMIDALFIASGGCTEGGGKRARKYSTQNLRKFPTVTFFSPKEKSVQLFLHR